jgi:hypothetical protein
MVSVLIFFSIGGCEIDNSEKKEELLLRSNCSCSQHAIIFCISLFGMQSYEHVYGSLPSSEIYLQLIYFLLFSLAVCLEQVHKLFCDSR